MPFFNLKSTIHGKLHKFLPSQFSFSRFEETIGLELFLGWTKAKIFNSLPPAFVVMKKMI